MTNSFLAEAYELADEIVAIRRDLHAHPELGFKEVRTARIVAAGRQRRTESTSTRSTLCSSTSRRRKATMISA